MINEYWLQGFTVGAVFANIVWTVVITILLVVVKKRKL